MARNVDWAEVEEMSLSQLSRSIDGLVAVVTGAGSGMGAATAKLFADQGAKVAALDINTAGVAAVVDEISTAGKTAKAWTIDLSDGDAIHQIIEDIAAHFGGIDLLINNAGISIPAPIDGDAYESAWDK